MSVPKRSPWVRAVVWGAATGLTACDPAPGPAELPPAAEGPLLVLTGLASAGALLPITTAPSDAWNVARLEGDCPLRDGDTLSGPCTLPDGRALEGSVEVEEVPDGGTWRFDGWTVDGVRVDGTLVWVRTDAADTLAGYDLAVVAANGAATWSFYVSGRDEAGWRTIEGTADVGEAALESAIDCDTPGAGDWVAAEDAVTATLEACGCSTWEGTEAEGEWCG